MNEQIIFASLKARPVRTLVSILAVALEVVLILMIVGLTKGMANETGKRVEGVGADIILLPSGASVFLALSGSAVPVGYANVVAGIQGVQAVAPVLSNMNTQDSVEMVSGIDPSSFDKVSGGFEFLKGRMFKNPHEIIVDDLFAASKHADVGESVNLLNDKFTISGIVEHGKGARVYMALSELQDLMGAVNKASYLYVKLQDPSRFDAVATAIRDKLPGYKTVNARDYASLMTSDAIPGLNEFISTVVFISICVGVLVIFLSMYTTITERTREIGILRSLGASKAFVVNLILRESIMLCMAGIVIGVIGSELIRAGTTYIFPTLTVLITPNWIVYAALFAILSGILGAIYPAFKAAVKDPIEALAYE